MAPCAQQVGWCVRGLPRIAGIAGTLRPNRTAFRWSVSTRNGAGRARSHGRVFSRRKEAGDVVGYFLSAWGRAFVT
jgi:hypothetical protein